MCAELACHRKGARYRQEVKTTFLLPCICAAVMGVIAFLVYALVNKVTGYYQIGLLISIPVAMVVYGLLIVLTRAVTAEELAGYAVRNAHSAAVPEISLNVSQYRIFYFHALPFSTLRTAHSTNPMASAICSTMLTPIQWLMRELSAWLPNQVPACIQL